MVITKNAHINKLKKFMKLDKIFEISKRDNIPAHQAADRMAEERIESVSKSRSTFLRNEHNIISRRNG